MSASQRGNGNTWQTKKTISGSDGDECQHTLPLLTVLKEPAVLNVRFCECAELKLVSERSLTGVPLGVWKALWLR